jgi:phosphatidylserine/phosphatidylglycerophosphate/cardiolipin synthase-like enzyme
VSDIPIRILFAPDHSPEMEIMKQMAKAKSRVDFAIFTFSKSSGIDDMMIQLTQGSGRTVRGLLDGQAANQTWAATRPVKNAGARLLVTKARPGLPLGKLHHKLMVVDEQLIIAGSFNYTGPANRLNDENIVILGNLKSTGESKKKQKLLARYALDEIDRIEATFGEEV